MKYRNAALMLPLLAAIMAGRHFQLVHPSEGMAGGGSGECQLPDGKTIDASFPTA